MSDEARQDRRKFLLTVLRGGAAALLVGGTIALTGRRGECVNNQVCGGCGQREECDLPAAQAFKEAAERR